jgi:hypothetical protein
LEGFGSESVDELGVSLIGRERGEKRGGEIERLGRGLVCCQELLMVGKAVLAKVQKVRAYGAQLL